MTLQELTDRIEEKTAVLGVIGLGYVGLPVAAIFAEAGYQVIGVDIKAARVETINAGRSPIEGNEPGFLALLERVVSSGRLIAAADYGTLANADVVLIAVETPVGEDHIPRFEALTSALRSLGQVLKEGALVVVESTIAPGTMDRLVLPLLEETTSRLVNEGFYLGHCPERVMPGRLLDNLRNVSRVCGGYNSQTSEVMVSLYRNVVCADLDEGDCVTAELVKTAENAYRDVNIAFANELALICEAVGGDVWQVRELVNKSPGRNVLLPGAGVGGHCIPKDPWLLAYGSGRVRDRLNIIPSARAVNDAMPYHIASLAEDALMQAGIEISKAKILVLGYAYLENSDDVRNSPSKILVEFLEGKGSQVTIHDPFVSEFAGNIETISRGQDALVLMVAHDAYTNLRIGELGVPVIIDGRGVYRGVSNVEEDIRLKIVGIGS